MQKKENRKTYAVNVIDNFCVEREIACSGRFHERHLIAAIGYSCQLRRVDCMLNVQLSLQAAMTVTNICKW